MSARKRMVASRRATRWVARCAARRSSHDDGFSARYDLDRIAGTFSRPAHKLAGQSYVGTHPRAGHREGRRRERLDAARDAVARRSCPLAIVFNTVNPILVQGAALGDVPMLAGFDGDITSLVPNGARLALDPSKRILVIVEK